MKAMDFLLKSGDHGPKGGNLNNPAQHPERRNASYNATDTGLHRSEGFRDTAGPGLKNEQPWHAMAAYMLLAGRTNSEIAMAAGVTPQSICTLRANRWFQEKLALLANEHGQDILGLLQGEAHASLQRMIEVRDAIYEKPTIATERLAYQAAKDIFELAHGKATQTVISSVSHTTHSSPSEEMESINQQLNALRSAQQRETLPALPDVFSTSQEG